MKGGKKGCLRTSIKLCVHSPSLNACTNIVLPADSWKGTQEKQEDPYTSGGWGNNSWGRSPQASAAAPRQVSMPIRQIMLAAVHYLRCCITAVCCDIHNMYVVWHSTCKLKVSHSQCMALKQPFAWSMHNTCTTQVSSRSPHCDKRRCDTILLHSNT